MPMKESGVANGQWMVIATVPDVCKSPTVPVPYPIVGLLSNSVGHSANVRFSGSPVFTHGARVTTVVGNEAGIGGGVKSQVNKGFCRPITHNPTLRVNGKHVLNHQMAVFEMNCGGPEGPGNTVGMLVYSGFMGTANAGAGGTIPRTLPFSCETPLESSFLESISSQVGGIQNLVDYGQQAYSLATMDWSNPGAVLGAIGSVAGISGFSEVAHVAGYAQQAYNFATSDWDNPGAVLGAASNIGGQLLAANRPRSEFPYDVPTCF